MKNLEAEYRKSQQEEAPDLWNRIESALPEKIPMAVSDTANVVTSSAVLVETSGKTPAAKNKIRRFTSIASVAAAALVLALVIPGAWILMNQGNYAEKSDCAAPENMAAADCVQPESQLEDMPDDAADREMWNGEATGNPADVPVQNESGNISSGTGIQGNSGNVVGEHLCEGSPEQDSAVALPTEELADGMSESEVTAEDKQEITGIFTVEKIVVENGEKIYYLVNTDGGIYRAVFTAAAGTGTGNITEIPKESTAETDIEEGLSVGGSYTFTLRPLEGEQRQYEILKMEQQK